MKHLLLFLMFSPLLLSANQMPGFGGITKAIQSGDVGTLSTYLDETVEISILDEEDIYDKEEAIDLLSEFFSQNRPSAYSAVHQGRSKGADAQYCIGELIAGSNKYRVYVYTIEEGGKTLIQELRFDRE